ncbi:MAG: hypothetical protein RPU13_13830 [Candidatus Sedimenticola sp. (ex Thyasira tokunagai)]
MSDRITHADTLAAADEPNIPVLAFVELDFASEPLRLHTGVGELPWNGYTWLGAGALGEISEIQEGSELQSSDIQMALNGIDPALISTAMSEDYQGRSAKIWLAILDHDHQVVGDPIGPFTGSMDTMDGEVGKEGRIVLTVKNRLADWERPRIRRYTNEDQQAEYPGDRGLEFISQMVEKELVW